MEHPLHVFQYCPRCGSADFSVNDARSKRCGSCGFVYYLNPSASVACFIRDKEGHLLVVRRRCEPAKGTLDLPGGFAELDETLEEALQREVKEETGLTLTSYRCRGVVTFLLGELTEYMFLYTADAWTGTLVKDAARNEGILEWVPKEQVEQLPIWEGDKIFFRLLKEDRPFFSLKLRYEDDTLAEAVLDGKRLL